METRIDPLLKVEQFIYDRSGNLFQHVDRRGQATTYRYDGLDRLTSATYADGSTTTYGYDAGNRLRTVVDSLSGTITLDYDDLDRLTSETSLRGTVTYGYDDAGRRTSMTVAGQPAVTYGYDDADRLTSITQGASVVTFEYDTADRRTAVVLPNGVRVEYGYTAASQLAGLTYKLGQTVLGTLSYTYDAAGRRETVTGTWARTRLPGVLTSATYDAANRLTAWNGASLTYDDNGNLLTEGSRSYGWDARNRLSAVSGLQPATFAYDAFGRRVSKSAPSGTTEYLYDGAEAVQELVGATPSANLLYGPGIDELLLRADGAGARWLVADGLGSALALLDPTGAVTTEYTYDAFGTTTATGEASANAAQFTGRENDGTGLYYYRARYYSPRLQRFLNEDPIGFAAGDPNLYGYVGNGPTMWVDPLGFDRMDRFLDGLQTALDAIGLVPGFELADLFSGIVSYGRGDNVGAALSMAAMWPAGGQIATAAKAGRCFNKDPQALIELAKECKRKGGVNPEEAETLLKWAKEKEISIPARGPEVHPNRNFDKPHIHIGPVNHIPVR